MPAVQNAGIIKNILADTFGQAHKKQKPVTKNKQLIEVTFFNEQH